MSKAKCEEHNWHVDSSTVMRFHGVGGARCVRAKVANVITTFVGVVKDVGGVQRAGFSLP